MTRDCTELLQKLLPHTTFNCGRLGVLPYADFRNVYRAATGWDTLDVEGAKPNVPEGQLTELTDVLRALLRKYIVDDQFGNRLVHVFGGIPVLGVDKFTLDLVRAAAVLGPDRATQWLYKWANGEPVSYQLCAALSGLTVDQPLEMEGGICFRTLPNSFADDGVHLPFRSTFQVGQLKMLGALKVAIDCKAGPSLCRPEEIEHSPPQRAWDYGPFPLDPLATLCEVMSLVFNCHVSPIIQWPDFSEEVRAFGLVLGSSWSANAQDAFSPASNERILEEHLKDIRILLVTRLASEGGRQGLDLAIRRWMGSKDRKNYADQFIDLRIALEALYLPGTDSELGFRLSTRGAWHLGASYEERNKYQKILRDAYDRGSKAVHASVVEFSEENRKLLADAQDLCRKGILKRLDEDEEPNWNELILGKEN